MGIENLKGLITNKLTLIDIENKNSNDEERAKVYRPYHELNGIKQALRLMGFNLELQINYYYFENGQASTFTIDLI